MLLWTAGSISVAIVDSLSCFSTQLITPTGALAGSFLGFVSTGVTTSLTLTSVQGLPGDNPLWPTVDDLTLAVVVAVPRSGIYAMFLAGHRCPGLPSPPPSRRIHSSATLDSFRRRRS